MSTLLGFGGIIIRNVSDSYNFNFNSVLVGRKKADTNYYKISHSTGGKMWYFGNDSTIKV